MTTAAHDDHDPLLQGRPGRLLRIAAWGVLGGLLLLPAIAMQFTDEVDWDGTDFIVMGILLGATGLAIELAVRMARHWAARLGAAAAVGGALLMVWSNLAVGIIGSEDNPANLLYAGVLGVFIGGACGSRFQPAGMFRTMVATAIAQALIALGAIAGGWGMPWSRPTEILAITGFFTAIWLFAALLFRHAARH